MVAFQTSVPYFSAKPAIHCTKQHNSAISHEGQTWRGEEKHGLFSIVIVYFSLTLFQKFIS